MEQLALQSSDGTSLTAYRWPSAATRTGDVLVVHGYAEHIGRYGHVAERLTAAGYQVTGLDLRGHGNSDGRRGHVKAWSDYVADVRAAQAAIGGPHTILAHSMGGLVVLDALLEDASQVTEAMLVAPLLRPLVEVPGWKRLAARLLSKVAPAVSLPSDIDPQLLSHDPSVIDAYKSDPMVFGTATARWYREMIRAGERVRHHAADFTLPLFIAWGADDRIVDPLALSEFCARYGGPIEAFTPHGYYHEVLNEPGFEAVDRMLGWLEDRRGNGAADS